MLLEQLLFSYEPHLRNTIITIGQSIVQDYKQKNFILLIDERIVAAQEAIATVLIEKASIVLSIVGGEAIKTREQVSSIQDKLMQQGFGSDSHLVAVGGGTILDLAGFIASTYCRGIRYTAIPTTLLAMVDAGIGGKNGINLGGMKNKIGTIYQPDEVLIDIHFLDTLPSSEIGNGLVEMIKHKLLVGERSILEMIGGVLSKDPKITVQEIRESIAIKASIIEQSFQRRGMRDLLNFGHTIGHAIEALERFTITHGQAVAMGIMVESRLGQLSQEEICRIDQFIHSVGLTLKLTRKYSFEEWHTCLLHDKKAVGEKPRFVMLGAIGHPRHDTSQYCHEIEKDKIDSAIQWLQEWAV